MSRRRAFWKPRTAASVSGPKIPSTVRASSAGPADAAAAREALAEPGKSVPWEQVRAEARPGAAVRYRIERRPHARKAFLALDKPVRRRIGEAVDALAQSRRMVPQASD